MSYTEKARPMSRRRVDRRGMFNLAFNNISTERKELKSHDQNVCLDSTVAGAIICDSTHDADRLVLPTKKTGRQSRRTSASQVTCDTGARRLSQV